MDAQSALAAIAEVAIAIAGFSTIAAAITTRTAADRTLQTWFRFRVLLQVSMSITLLAYLPMVLSHAVATPETLWRICSAIYLAWTVILAIVTLNDAKAIDAVMVERPTALFAALTILDLALHLGNIVYFHAIWPYLAGLGCGVAIAMVQFFVLLRGFWWRAA